MQQELPIYEVEEVLLERRLREEKYFIMINGNKVEHERRKNSQHNNKNTSLTKTREQN